MGMIALRIRSLKETCCGSTAGPYHHEPAAGASAAQRPPALTFCHTPSRCQVMSLHRALLEAVAVWSLGATACTAKVHQASQLQRLVASQSSASCWA